MAGWLVLKQPVGISALVRVYDFGWTSSSGSFLPLFSLFLVHQQINQQEQGRLLTARPQNFFQPGYTDFIAFHQNRFSILRSNACTR